MNSAGAESDISTILADPSRHYATPKDVLSDARLSSSDKRRVLDAMEHNARELAVAAEENMGGGETLALDEILDAQRQLRD